MLKGINKNTNKRFVINANNYTTYLNYNMVFKNTIMNYFSTLGVNVSSIVLYYVLLIFIFM